MTTRTPCRSTRHCADHGFCHRCASDLSQQALAILATLREQLADERQVTAAYNAVTAILEAGPGNTADVRGLADEEAQP